MKKALIFVLSFWLASASSAAVPDAALGTVIDNSAAKAAARVSCGEADEGIDKIKLLAGISTGVSAVGTLAGGAAAVAGHLKSENDKDIVSRLSGEEEALCVRWVEGKDRDKFIADDLRKVAYRMLMDMGADVSYRVDRKGPSAYGVARTAGTFTAGGTSAVAAGTALGGAFGIDFDKIKKAIQDCEKAAAETRDLQIAAACHGFKPQNLNVIKTTMMIGGFLSIAGTATGVVGGVKSLDAAKAERKNGISGEGASGAEKTANALAVATAGTSLASGLLTGVPLVDLQKNSIIVKKCLEALR